MEGEIDFEAVQQLLIDCQESAGYKNRYTWRGEATQQLYTAFQKHPIPSFQLHPMPEGNCFRGYFRTSKSRVVFCVSIACHTDGIMVQLWSENGDRLIDNTNHTNLEIANNTPNYLNSVQLLTSPDTLRMALSAWIEDTPTWPACRK